MPRVAVVIPTYNRASLLERAIDSVLKQTYRDYEVIVVDDGSEDGTADLMERQKSCRYIRLPHSGLPAVARNTGVRSTAAPFIAFLDSDDRWREDKLEKQVAEIRFQRAGLVCSNASVAPDGRGVTMPYLRPGQGRSGWVLLDLIADNFVITSSVLMRREVFELAGGFSESPAFRIVEDFGLWLSAAVFTDFHYLPDELVIYNTSGSRLSREIDTMVHWRARFQILSAFLSSAEREPEVVAAVSSQLDGCRSALCDLFIDRHSFRNFASVFLRFSCRRPWPALKYAAGRILKKHENPAHS